MDPVGLLLDTIGQAIHDLRVTPAQHEDLHAVMLDVANDLAFAHGAVTARRHRSGGSPTSDGAPPVRGEGAVHLRLVT